MKTLEMTKEDRVLAQYAQCARKEPVILTKRGKPIAALVSMAGVDWETISLSTNPKFLEILRRSGERYKKEGGISSAEMRRRFGLK